MSVQLPRDNASGARSAWLDLVTECSATHPTAEAIVRALMGSLDTIPSRS